MKIDFLIKEKKIIRREKTYKFLSTSVIIMTVLNMSFSGMFFMFAPVAEADSTESMCAADLDMVMIIDRSGTMKGEEPMKITAAISAADYFVGLLGSNDQSALVSFSTDVTLDKTLSNNHTETINQIDSLSAYGFTNIGDAIVSATGELSSSRAKSQAVKAMILLTDGMANRPNGTGSNENPVDVAYAENMASAAKALGYKIFTIGLGADVNGDMLKNIANSADDYYFSPSTADLQGIYSQISAKICEYASISGCKFYDNDKDGDSADFSSEAKSSGWTISIFGGSLTAPKTQKTDDNGCYTFSGLDQGTYTISETGKDGVAVYEQTYPVLGSPYSYTVDWGENVTDAHFGNYLPTCGNLIVDDYPSYQEACEIGQTLACDSDGYNGVKTCANDCNWGNCVPTEYCGDGKINDSEQCDGSDLGSYDPAHYKCSEGCTVVYESYCGDLITQSPNFCGQYEQCDGDASKACTTLNGYVGIESCNSCSWSGCTTDQKCGDGVKNGAETCDDGANNGKYGFCNADCSGNTPSVCGNSIKEGTEACDDGVNGSATCTGQCTLIGGKVTVCKLIDADGNASTTADQTPAATPWTFTISPVSSTTESLATTTGAASNCVTFDNLSPDTYSVQEVAQSGWSQLSTNGSTTINIALGSVVSVDFINTKTIVPVSSISGYKYNDVNKNGAIDSGDTKISNWEIGLWRCPYTPLETGTSTLLSNDRFVVATSTEGLSGFCTRQATSTTNGDGYYEFTNLSSGDYGVAETQVSGWTQTYPQNNLAYYLNLPTGLSLTAINFANFKAPVCGDAVCNGQETCSSCSNDCGSCGGGGPVCGNGVKESGEECDGSAPSGYTCNNSCNLKRNSSGGGGTPSYFTTPHDPVVPPVVKGEEGKPELKLEKKAEKTMVNPGEKINFTLTVENIGTLTAYNVILKDVLPESLKFADSNETEMSWILGDMAVGDVKLIEVAAVVKSDAKAQVFTNTAEVFADNNAPVKASDNFEIKVVKVLAATGFDAKEFSALNLVLFMMLGSILYLRRKIA